MGEDPSPTRWSFEVSWRADCFFVIIVIVLFCLIVQFDVVSFRSSFYQDFKSFWDDRFGRKKDLSKENSNSNNASDQRDSVTNGSVKRSSDLAIYEQYENQVDSCFFFLLF